MSENKADQDNYWSNSKHSDLFLLKHDSHQRLATVKVYQEMWA